MSTFVFLTNGNGAPQKEANVSDISEEGMGVRFGEPLEPGTFLLVIFLNKKTSAHITKRARVAHCTTDGIGSWLIGLEFTERLPLCLINEFV